MEKTKKQSNRFNFGVAISIALVSASISSYATFKNYDSLIRLNNLKQYKVAKYSAQHPYDLVIERETKNDTVFSYLKDNKTGKKLQIFRGLNVGTLDQRIDSIWGNSNDKESVKHKINSLKKSIKNKYKEFKESFYEHKKSN
jgi:hypothetical protein